MEVRMEVQMKASDQEVQVGRRELLEKGGRHRHLRGAFGRWITETLKVFRQIRTPGRFFKK